MKHIYFLAAVLLFACIKIDAQTIDVITGLESPGSMSFNGNDLYFIQGGHKISKIDITDNPPTPIDVITGLDAANAIVRKGNDLYISYFDDKISKIDITDPTPTPIDLITGLYRNVGAVIYGNDLFYGKLDANSIWKIDITNTPPVEETYVIGVSYAPKPTATIGNYLYYNVGADPRISKIDLTANPPIEIHVTFNLVCPVDQVAYGSELYISDPCQGNGAILRLDTTTNLSTVELLNLSSPRSLAINGNYLYIVEYGENKIIKLELPLLPPTINIPDTNFKNTLVNTNCADLDGNGTIDGDADTNNDGEIQVSEAEAVFGLDVSANDITSMEGVLGFINLTSLDCSANHIINLNISNGNNVSLVNFNAVDNTALFCIQVDDENYANNAPNWFKDNWAEYSEFCVLGVEELDLSSQIIMYPNPVKDVLTFDNTSSTEITSIKLYDILGRLVMLVEDDFNQIDMSHVDSGVFFLNIETEKGVITKKLIKE